MSDKEKKTYDAPDIEKIPLSDEGLDKVTGGAQPDGATDGDDLPPDPDSELVGGIDYIPPRSAGLGQSRCRPRVGPGRRLRRHVLSQIRKNLQFRPQQQMLRKGDLP